MTVSAGRTVFRAIALLALLCIGVAGAPARAETSAMPGTGHGDGRGDGSDDEAAVREARAVMDAFMAAFNARDPVALADTLVYPHVRFASQRVAVYPDREAFIAASDMEAFARSTGWAYSRWDELQVIHAAPLKVHFAVVFTRLGADDAIIATYRSLYVLERIDGRWGIRARSSFAP